MHGDVEKTHALEVDLENGDVGAKAGGHACGINSGGATSDDHDATWENARHAAEQNPASACVFGQKVGTDNHGHAAGDFGHRFKKGQAPALRDHFVSDGGDTRLYQGLS